MDHLQTEIHIGRAVFTPESRTLNIGGRRTRLQPKAAAVLSRLVDSQGRVVSREALIADCWPAGAGSDEALTQVVAQLRRAFGDHGRGEGGAIETLAKAGYRLIPPAALLANSHGGGAAGLAAAPSRLSAPAWWIAAALAAAVLVMGVSTADDPHALRHAVRHGSMAH